MASQSAAIDSNQGSIWSGGEKKPFKASYGKLMMWYFLLSDAFTFAGFLIAYGALRFSNLSWPVPDKVFQSFPGIVDHGWPLIFVTVMSFILIVSSVTMVRAVQEGHEENRSGVVKWVVATIIGGAMFLGCQALEWSHLLHEGMTVLTNPFATNDKGGAYVLKKGGVEPFEKGSDYALMTKEHLYHALAAKEAGDHYDHAAIEAYEKYSYKNVLKQVVEDGKVSMVETGLLGKEYYAVDSNNELVKSEKLVQKTGPKAFGALFFCITGFHGFHVFSGLVILTIICVNAAGGLYVDRKNGSEMVEKVGLYWHFVDLVWVFVFLAFYLL